MTTRTSAAPCRTAPAPDARAMPGQALLAWLALAAGLIASAPGAHAQGTATPAEAKVAPGAPRPSNPRTGKLLLTGGVSSVEGAAGGGITPWAVIGTHSTGSGMGASGYGSYIKTRNYAMNGYGAAVGFGFAAFSSVNERIS